MSTTDGMTYEEWLAEQKAKSEAKVEADYTSAKNDINTTYDETVKKVESDHQRTLTDIDTSYQKNLAGYGRNAELLASMGLTNSGYSDYLNSQAFAQKSSTTRSANRDRATLLEGADKSRKSALETAAATRENALNSIDTTYQSAIFDYRSDKFNKLYTNALNGMYAGLEEEALNKLITENHLTSDQAEELKSAISFYNTQKADTDKKTAFDNISALASSGHFYGKTDDEIRTALEESNLTTPEINIILQANSKYVTDFNAGVWEKYNSMYFDDVATVKTFLKNNGVAEDSALGMEIISAQQASNAEAIITELRLGYTYTAEDLEKLASDKEITDTAKNSIMAAFNIKPTGQPENNNDVTDTGDSVDGEKDNNGETYVAANSSFTPSDDRGNGSGSFNGVNYSISGLNDFAWSLATDTFDLNLDGQTYTLAKGLYANSTKLDELYPKASRGTIVVLNRKIYIAEGAGLWCAPELENQNAEAYQKIVAAFNKTTVATSDTSYGANVGTGTGGSASSNINNRPNQFSQVVLR